MQDISGDASSGYRNSTIQKDSATTADDTVGSDMEIERARSVESDQTYHAQDREDGLVEEEVDFAPIPVEDWLLKIEQLIARKDYAEAARQLEKFKQAHPKVNVEDLESKIP